MRRAQGLGELWQSDHFDYAGAEARRTSELLSLPFVCKNGSIG
jgi:hypothetical protein